MGGSNQIKLGGLHRILGYLRYVLQWLVGFGSKGSMVPQTLESSPSSSRALPLSGRGFDLMEVKHFGTAYLSLLLGSRLVLELNTTLLRLFLDQLFKAPRLIAWLALFQDLVARASQKKMHQCHLPWLHPIRIAKALESKSLDLVVKLLLRPHSMLKTVSLDKCLVPGSHKSRGVQTIN